MREGYPPAAAADRGSPSGPYRQLTIGGPGSKTPSPTKEGPLQDIRATPRLVTVAAIALVVAAIAAFALLSGGGVAGAAGTGGSAPSGQMQPVQSGEDNTPDRGRDGTPCPEGEQGGSGDGPGSGEAPGESTPDTAL